MEFDIKPVEAKDAQGLNTLRRMPGVCENIIALPHERLKPTEDFIGSLNENTQWFTRITRDRESGRLFWRR
jgi:hypothetical protein